jgi:hypothetical protein
MPRDLDPIFWVDILKRKHECGPYLSDPIKVEVSHNGRSLDVWMPKPLPDFHRTRIEATAESDGLLFLVASHSLQRDDPEGRGILMVARRREDGSYVVHVWHELFPWSLGRLGLSPGVGP